jgi:phosphodiesterase/alkaline phosphatase D-like protein
MTNLKPGTAYSYHVGSQQGYSSIWTFNTLPSFTDYKCTPTMTDSNGAPVVDSAPNAWPTLNIGVIGDMAYDNMSDATVAHLLASLNNGSLDVIVHAGDISYADGYQPHWDALYVNCLCLLCSFCHTIVS